MAETPPRLCERLSEEGRRTVEFFTSLEPAGWESQVYAEGGRWSARQVLAHFVSAEIGFRQIITDIINGGEGAPEGLDIDRFNESQVAQMAAMSCDDLLAQFEQNRDLTVELVGRMETGDLEKVGRHPFLGRARLDEIIKLLYRHNQIHQRDIRRALAAGAGKLQT